MVTGFFIFFTDQPHIDTPKAARLIALGRGTFVRANPFSDGAMRISRSLTPSVRGLAAKPERRRFDFVTGHLTSITYNWR